MFNNELKRKMVELKRRNFDTYGGFDDMSFDEIEKLMNEFKNGVNADSDVKFIVRSNSEGYHGGGCDISFIAERLETDVEYENRMEDIKSSQEKKKQKQIDVLKCKLHELQK